MKDGARIIVNVADQKENENKNTGIKETKEEKGQTTDFEETERCRWQHGKKMIGCGEWPG